MTATRTAAEPYLLQVKELTTKFRTPAGPATAVDKLSFAVRAGETLAVVGESGSGKSVSALSIMGLVPNPPGSITGGEIYYRDTNLLSLSDRQMERIRGAEIALISQEPMSALNPVLSIGRQLTETITHHQHLGRERARQQALQMMELVQIPEAAKRLAQYPHQLSGGMLQRVVIAMALSCNPKILIADEPTTALDVTIQAQILTLMQTLQRQLDAAIVLITHDLGVVAETADRVVVMYAGSKVEEADVFALFDEPLHPYTQGLMQAVPRLRQTRRARLSEIPGVVPPLSDLPQGCRFAPRCPRADRQCRERRPSLEEKRSGRWAACWHAE